MDRRFSLGLIVVFLIGGAIVLWLSPPRNAAPATTAQSAPPPIAADGKGTFGLYTLAVSWQPAFCEIEPRKPECRSLAAGRYDADHFTLHGLWPQEDYCGVSQQLIDADTYDPRGTLPAVALRDATRTALERVMPGTQSYLERHEWLTHGTCSGVSAEAYFSRAIAFMDSLNASAVRDLFVASMGKRLSAKAIRDAFNQAFGARAGERVRIECETDGDRNLLVELRIRLYGDVMGAASLSSLIARATPGGSGCPSGLVDRIGDQ